jgi:hypothetical protein
MHQQMLGTQVWAGGWWYVDCQVEAAASMVELAADGQGCTCMLVGTRSGMKRGALLQIGGIARQTTCRPRPGRHVGSRGEGACPWVWHRLWQLLPNTVHHFISRTVPMPPRKAHHLLSWGGLPGGPWHTRRSWCWWVRLCWGTPAGHAAGNAGVRRQGGGSAGRWSRGTGA